MNDRNGLPWMGLAVGLATAALGGLWMALAHVTGQGPGGLAILGGLSLLMLVMAGRCGQVARVESRAATGRCEACGSGLQGADACPRCRAH
jgi:hypothetical protein